MNQQEIEGTDWMAVAVRIANNIHNERDDEYDGLPKDLGRVLDRWSVQMDEERERELAAAFDREIDTSLEVGNWVPSCEANLALISRGRRRMRAI